MRSALGRFLLGVFLCAGAALLYFNKGFPDGGDTSTAMSLPLRADGGWSESKPFRVRHPGIYRASLRLDSIYAFREMECLADVGSAPGTTEPARRTDCPDGFAPGRVEWRVTHNGKYLPSDGNFGLHAGEYSATNVGRSLASYDLGSSGTYAVNARLLDAPPRLWPTRPALVIEYDHVDDLIISFLFYSVLAGGLTLAGLWFLVGGIVRLLAGRRQ